MHVVVQPNFIFLLRKLLHVPEDTGNVFTGGVTVIGFKVIFPGSFGGGPGGTLLGMQQVII